MTNNAFEVGKAHSEPGNATGVGYLWQLRRHRIAVAAARQSLWQWLLHPRRTAERQAEEYTYVMSLLPQVPPAGV